MSPLGFDAKEMYQFISERFIGTNVEVQRQALQWLQLLCLLNIQIPMEILFDMFTEGIKTLHKGPLAIGKISLLFIHYKVASSRLVYYSILNFFG